MKVMKHIFFCVMVFAAMVSLVPEVNAMMEPKVELYHVTLLNDTGKPIHSVLHGIGVEGEEVSFPFL